VRSASVIACLVSLLATAGAESYDLVVRHGRVVDGTGNPAYFADVGVNNGHIVTIGQLGPKDTARTEIDATGLIVAPGFIDVHTHADDIAGTPEAQNFPRMGVTTVIVGNCGSSKLEVGKFFRDIDEKPISVNAATLIGHNTVRDKAMGGDFDRPPTVEEMRSMKALVEQGMKDGATGFSTGLIYLPGVFSKTEEIVELAKIVAAYDGIYTSHMRHEDSRIFSALDEVFQVAREGHVRAEVSHIKLAGERAWGQAAKVLEVIEKARTEGLDITQDLYAYTASSTGLRQTIPDWAFNGGRKKFLELLKDPTQKARLVEDMKKQIHARGREDYAYAVVASNDLDKALNGLNIVEAAKRLRGSNSLEDQIETIFTIEESGPADAIYHGINEDDMRKFMCHPNTMIASDSGLHKLGEGVPHPRGYGNNARVLGRYVRELNVLRLEDAIRKMTSLPATTFRLNQRGEIREGFWADLVVFDPKTVSDPATFAAPHHYALGISHVVVNGVSVIKDGEFTGAKPGQGLRHESAQSRGREISALGAAESPERLDDLTAFVRVSPRDNRYFELSNGRSYVPIGLNMIAPDGVFGSGETNGLRRMDDWFAKLEANGGNFARVWLSSDFWDVEHERSGSYDEAKGHRIDALFDSARRHGIRLKLTVEHFREMSETPRQRWANKLLHHVSHGGTASNMADFFAGSPSRDRFKSKLDWFAARYGSDPIIFGWELWNEVNAVSGGDYLGWTEAMLPELHRRFPKNLAMQSLGSFDGDYARTAYQRLTQMPGNDIAQVHRYLDLGASYPVCHEPVDMLASDAVRTLLAWEPQRPVLLAESGAVEPRHSGPSKLYAKDKEGIILHDILFAPFFSGAAGPGHCWHWGEYVDRNNLWHHFARFAEVLKQVDVPGEHFKPIQIENPRLRVYALKGEQTTLVWCRDRENTWQTELVSGQSPAPVMESLDLTKLANGSAKLRGRAYDPWHGTWSELQIASRTCDLPEFTRSLVLVLLSEPVP
jgi:N-acyl-D-amino-acid deacylase